MSNILHMDTEAVRSTAAQLDQVLGDLQQKLTYMTSTVEYADWQGPGRDQYVNDFTDFSRNAWNQVDVVKELMNRVRNEVDEWETLASGLSSSTGSWFSKISPLFDAGMIALGGYMDYMTQTGRYTLWSAGIIPALPTVDDYIKYPGGVSWMLYKGSSALSSGLSGAANSLKNAFGGGFISGDIAGGALAAVGIGISAYTNYQEVKTSDNAVVKTVANTVVDTAITALVGGFVGGALTAVGGPVAGYAGYMAVSFLYNAVAKDFVHQGVNSLVDGGANLINQAKQSHAVDNTLRQASMPMVSTFSTA